MNIDVPDVLLAAAIVSFLVAALGKWAAGVPVGLACFAAAFLVPRLF